MLLVLLELDPAADPQVVHLLQRLVVVRQDHLRLQRASLARRGQNDFLDHRHHRR
ncbi:hypothetical protein FQZ97_633130 [compost metagenome]